MGLHEVKMTPEEVDDYIASRITDLADSIINIKKYVEMLENKPMVKKDWERCDNTIDHFRDAITSLSNMDLHRKQEPILCDLCHSGPHR